MKKNNDIKKNTFIILFIIIIAISLILRLAGLNVKTDDMNDFQEWFYQLKDNGGLLALRNNIGSYNLPYMTILALLTYLPIDPIISIKVVSIFFDYIIGIFAILIYIEIFKDKKKKLIDSIIIFTFVMLAPTMVINSAWWGQCDSIYVSFIIISLYFLLKEKYIKSLMFLGISFSFKLQFAFILPVYGLVYLSKKKCPLYYFVIIPIMNFVMSLPAIMVGRPMKDCLLVYFGQTTVFNNFISMNFPGIYNIICKTNYNVTCIPNINPYLGKIGILLVAVIFIMIAIIVIVKKYKYNNELILLTGIWGVIFSTFFLPYMHDRYIFIVDILSIIYAIIYKKRVYIPIIINFISLYSYFVYMFGIRIFTIDKVLVSILNLYLVIIATYCMVKDLEFNKKIEQQNIN